MKRVQRAFRNRLAHSHENRYRVKTENPRTNAKRADNSSSVCLYDL